MTQMYPDIEFGEAEEDEEKTKRRVRKGRGKYDKQTKRYFLKSFY